MILMFKITNEISYEHEPGVATFRRSPVSNEYNRKNISPLTTNAPHV